MTMYYGMGRQNFLWGLLVLGKRVFCRATFAETLALCPSILCSLGQAQAPRLRNEQVTLPLNRNCNHSAQVVTHDSARQLTCMHDRLESILIRSKSESHCMQPAAPRAARGGRDDAQGSCHVMCVDASRVVTSRASPGGAADVSGTQVGLLIVLWPAVPALTGRGQQLVPA